MTPGLPEHLLIDDQGRLCSALPNTVEMLLDYPEADFGKTSRMPLTKR